MWGYTCADALFAAFILLVISRPAARLPRVLSLRWLVRIGHVSYGMYVFNLAVWMYFFDRLRVGGEQPIWFLLVLFVPYLLIVYGLAELSYRFYEVRFIRLKDRFFRTPAAPKIAVS
jgi:peptidoglycan/LPS O-acetylase OafA/YrhL